MLNLKKKAFTLIELLVVVAILGVLATLAVVALQQARQNARDSKRLADAKQMHTAIELFYNENNRYPTTAEWESGEIKSVSSGNSFMYPIPSAPRVADGGCSENQNFYIYQPQNNEREYKLSFCLGKSSDNLNPGPKCLTPGGLLDQDCNIEGGVIAGGGSGGGTTQPTGGCLENDTGCIWQTHGPVALSDWACSSNLDIYNNELYISYRDMSEAGYLKMSKINTSGSSWEDLDVSVDIDNTSGKSSMQVFNGVSYVSYKDRYNSDKIITKRFVSGSWETLGDYTSSDIACHPSLAVYSNVPYVAFKDEASTEEVYVVKFIHGAWEQVGPSVSNGQKGTKPILRIHNGELHVMYRRDCDISTPKWVVKKFDGINWNQFGSPIEILHPDKSGHADFYIGTNGDMYVAYQGGNSDQTSQRGVVVKYNGTDWEPLGPNGGAFSDWHASQIALYVYQGTPYVAYKNGDSNLNPNQSKRGIVEVKRYNGSSWESVGPLASYESIYSNISILIDNNIIYLLYLESSSPENNFNDSLVVRKLVEGSITCTSFDYSVWSECSSEGLQTRSVLNSYPSGCSSGDPVLQQSCIPVCTSWDYSDWGECLCNDRTREIINSYPLGCSGGSPLLYQSDDNCPSIGTFIDIRDGQDYDWINIENQCWMAENLKYLPQVNPVSCSSASSHCFYVYGYNGTDINEAKLTENYQKYGVLYNRAAAMQSNYIESSRGVCPEGWHIPSHDELTILERSVCTTSTCETDFPLDKTTLGLRGTDEGSKMSYGSDWINDQLVSNPNFSIVGLKFLPGGARAHYNNSFMYIGERFIIWTSTVYNSYGNYSRYVDYNYITSNRGAPDSRNGLYIRCIKN